MLMKRNRWLYVPRGCAIFHVPIRNQHLMRSTLPTSHGFSPLNSQIASPFPKSAFVDAGKSEFVGNFEFVGTIDNAPYLCIPEALKWRESIGGEETIRAYNQKLAQEGGKHVASVLGTEVLDNKTHTLSRCCMVNIRLPFSFEKVQAAAAKNDIDKDYYGFAVRDWLNRVSIKDYNTFIQTMFYNDVWYARLSGQVYLEMSDFEWAAETLKKLCERVDSGEWATVKSNL